jgi:hypothetical protein
MKLFRFIPVYAAAAALLLVLAVSAAQTQQATDTAKETVKKTKKTSKRAEKQADSATENASQTPATARESNARSAGNGSAQRSMNTVSDSEIAAARASGKVWVNTETGVYHKGGRWYGGTKQGKFMTEDDAIKAGYRASKSK